jgi:formate dehydrogenase subunit gamma
MTTSPSTARAGKPSGPSGELGARIAAIAAAHRHERGALLPMLHAIQAELGYVPQEAVPLLAHELNLSRADVHGVVTFYHDFRAAPAGRTTVRICRAEACQALGAEALAACAREHTGTALGETSADGSVTLEQVFCFGNCALGPAVEVDGTLHGRMTGDRLRAVLDKAVSS